LLANIYDHWSNKANLITIPKYYQKPQIVFLPYNYGARHERKTRKVLIDTIPHTLTGSDRDIAYYSQQDIDRSSMKIDLWLRIMLVKQAYLY
jgi:hypothetical protein